jgi:alpha-tubulin suppressor-like RCC1 family protein
MKAKFFTQLTLSLMLSAIYPNYHAQTIGAGSVHSAALCNGDSLVRSWGANSSGQLGTNDTIEANIPAVVHGPGNIGGLKGIVAIVIRENFSLALKIDGTVWAWGYNGDGELGDNTKINELFPVQVHGASNIGNLTGIISLSAGYAHILALKNDGTVWAWGDNSNGELGNNNTVSTSIPVQVRGSDNIGFLTGISAIAAGQQFSLALKNDGTVWAWGENSTGQLGDNSSLERHTPVPVHSVDNTGVLRNITSLVAGGGHALALASDSTVYAWGFNINGELGNNTQLNDSLPAQVHGSNNSGILTGVSSISAGDYFSAAIGPGGTVWTWGFNFYGQLGVNDTTERNVPVEVHGPGNLGFLTGINAISLGDEHVIALKNDDSYWSWGWNAYGQLGDGSVTDKWIANPIINPCSAFLGINSINSDKHLSILPNPNSGSITLQSTEELGAIMIYTTLGDLVYSNITKEYSTQIDISNRAPGIYIVRVQNRSIKLVKE